MRYFCGLLSLCLGFLSGCARSTTEEILLEAENPASLIHFDRSVASLEFADEVRSDGSSLLLKNKETDSARRLERNLPVETQSQNIPEDEIEFFATLQMKQLFPSVTAEVVNVRRGLRFHYVEFQQTLGGRSVVNAKAVLRVDGNGDWVTANSSFIEPNLLPKNVSSEYVDVSSAIPARSEILSQRAVIYPRFDEKEGNEFFVAQELELHSKSVGAAYMLWVDEDSLEVVGALNPTKEFSHYTAVGTIVPNQPDDEPVIDVFPSLSIRIKDELFRTDANGSIDLTGHEGKMAVANLENDYFKVVNDGGLDNAIRFNVAEGESLALNIDAGSSLEERNLFFWLNQARDYLVNTLHFTELDYRLQVLARHGIAYDNAFFNPLLKVLAFGVGGKRLKNTALSRDVVFHEYGHAITQQIYGMQTSYEFRAMNEAFSDYFAASITNDPYIADGVMVPMDRVKASKKELEEWTPHMRSLETDLHLSRDFDGLRFHDDGQMFSGSLWRIRKELGAEFTDALVHEARLAQASSIVEFYLELRTIDEATDDMDYRTRSPNANTFRKAFKHHGLHTRARFVQASPEDLTIGWLKDL